MDAALNLEFLRHHPKGWDREVSMSQLCRLRAGFGTSTPLRPRGASIPRPGGGPAGPEVIAAMFDDGGEGSDGMDRVHQAEIDYREVCDDSTGGFVPDAAFEKLRERRETMDAQTCELARALECRGEQFHHGDNWAGRVTVIGAFSGAVLPLPPVRRVSFLPSIAASNRSKMLRDVEYFLAQHPIGCRMFTITAGCRTVFESPAQFREAQKAFCRRISKLQTAEPFRRYNVPKRLRRRRGRGGWRQIVSIEWRAIEYGTPQFEAGKLTLHLHAHLLVRELVPMTGKQRATFRRKLWRKLGRDADGQSVGRHWDDAGQIQNPREFVKYPVKPGDLETILRDGGPGLLRDFFEAVRGMHIVQPMGQLRADRSERRKKGRRIVAINGPDGRQLVEKFDWNAVKRPLPKRKKGREEYKQAAADLAAVMAGHRPDPEGERETEELAATDEGCRAPGTDPPARAGPAIVNRVIARLTPAPYAGPILEPAVVVWGFDGNHLAVYRQPAVAALRAAHRDAYTRARDARALALACAHAPAASEGPQRSNNCPPGIPAGPPRSGPDAWAGLELGELLALN